MSWLSDLLHWLFPDRPPGPTPPPPVPSDLLAEVNRVRAAHGLRAVAANAALARSAQGHAADMDGTGILSHDGFPGRLYAAGYPAGRPVGEVVAEGQRTAAEAVADWLDDPPHRAELLEPAYTAAGGVQSGSFWCVDFGG